MSQTSHRGTVTAATAVVFAVSALLAWSPAAELWSPSDTPLPRVAPSPVVATARSYVPPALVPPEPLGPLAVPLKQAGDEWADERPLRHVERFVTWTPSPAARTALIDTVGRRLGAPGTFTNAWCDEDRVCWTVADTQFLDVQGQRRALVTAAGVTIDERNIPEECHACSGYLSLVVLSPQGDEGWRVDAVRRGIPSGEFGATGLVRVVALGPSIPGWTIEDDYGEQGYFSHSLRLFAVDGPSVRAVLSTDTGVEEPDSAFSCSSGGVTTKLRFDRSTTDEGFYRLTGERATWRNDDGVERVVSRAPITLRYLSRIRSFRGIGVQAPHRPPKGEVPDCD